MRLSVNIEWFLIATVVRTVFFVREFHQPKSFEIPSYGKGEVDTPLSMPLYKIPKQSFVSPASEAGGTRSYRMGLE